MLEEDLAEEENLNYETPSVVESRKFEWMEWNSYWNLMYFY